jgi:hypothetical protein
MGSSLGCPSWSKHLDASLNALEKGPLNQELLEAVGRMGKIANADETPYWHGKLEYGYNTEKVLLGSKETMTRQFHRSTG